MTVAQVKTLSILAPAKINLFLHVTGRRDDGFHLLDSLVAFTDIGDEIRIEPATHFEFAVKGPFAGGFTAEELCNNADSQNIVVRAAHALAQISGNSLSCKVTLVKNMPLASGIGGGSSDAAAVIWGLINLWGLNSKAPYLDDLLLGLGADVPVCFACQACRMQGIGDIISPLRQFPELPIVLVNPNVSSPTHSIFKELNAYDEKALKIPDRFADIYEISEFLNSVDNHLFPPASARSPVISDVLTALRAPQHGALIARMSGSGATCFALYEDEDSARHASEEIAIKHPGWWVRQGWLGRPQRY